MTDDMKARALRAVQCDKWRWMRGMSTTDNLMVVAVDAFSGVQVTDGMGTWWRKPTESTPDFSDDATRGCLLALVREATCHPTAVVEVRPMHDGWRGIVAAPHATESWVYLSDWIMAPTPQLAEVSAIIDALEAA